LTKITERRKSPLQTSTPFQESEKYAYGISSYQVVGVQRIELRMPLKHGYGELDRNEKYKSS
jgi:hypothetical protein